MTACTVLFGHVCQNRSSIIFYRGLATSVQLFSSLTGGCNFTFLAISEFRKQLGAPAISSILCVPPATPLPTALSRKTQPLFSVVSYRTSSSVAGGRNPNPRRRCDILPRMLAATRAATLGPNRLSVTTSSLKVPQLRAIPAARRRPPSGPKPFALWRRVSSDGIEKRERSNEADFYYFCHSGEKSEKKK